MTRSVEATFDPFIYIFIAIAKPARSKAWNRVHEPDAVNRVCELDEVNRVHELSKAKLTGVEPDEANRVYELSEAEFCGQVIPRLFNICFESCKNLDIKDIREYLLKHLSNDHKTILCFTF